MYSVNRVFWLRLITFMPLIASLRSLTAFENFGFGVDFMNCVCVLMKDTESCVSYCGLHSDFFFNCGIWNSAGCPFSPLAFVLADEMLSIKTGDCRDLKGIRNWSNVNNINLEAAVKLHCFVYRRYNIVFAK